MSKWMARSSVVVALAFFAPPAFVCAQESAPPPAVAAQQVASVEQLKLQAFQAFKGGEFDRTSELLSQAASISQDPSLTRMSEWIHQFQTQRQGYVQERRKGFDKAVADVKLLLDEKRDGFAIDRAKDAYLLADDKDAFRKEAWVDALVRETTQMAAEAEKDEHWLKALRLYSDLGAIEPANPEWKERLKLATRRIRLLAVYTPDDFKLLQDVEVAEREQVDQILNPTTQPTTKPANEENETFKTDWHDLMRGIRMDMLVDALEDTRGNYFRDVSYKRLAIGGLQAMQALATTRGLEKTFPKLGDTAARDEFVAAIDQSIRGVENAATNNEHIMLRVALMNLQQANRETVGLPEEVLVSEFADGAFAELDPFSSMIWPSSLDDFNKSTQGEFSGVGIQIQNDEEGNLKVVSPLEDSPAYRLGIKAGDVITRINGKNAKNITTDQAVKHITGPQGSTVLLTVRSPDGTVKDYTIRREQIKVASVKGWLHKPGGGWEYLVDPDQKIAYVRLTNFTKTTDDELTRALSDMRRAGAKGLILDLRHNPGGLLTAATEVADKFLKDGNIVSTRAERPMPQQPPIDARASADDMDIPIVVLVNQYSASASEIVSGALQDQHRALIVGERTFGKGSVQMLFPLSNRQAALKLTTSHYYLPSGRCIHREETSTTWGVDPNLTVEMTPKQMRDAIEARQELDVLRLQETPAAPVVVTAAPATQPGATVTEKKDLLACDPQLSAALLLLRLQLAGGATM